MNRIMVMLFVVLSSAATLNLHAMQTSDPRISNEKALALINMDPQDPSYKTDYSLYDTGVLMEPSPGPISGSKRWYYNRAVPAGTFVDIPKDADRELITWTAPNGKTVDLMKVTLSRGGEVIVNACGNHHPPDGPIIVKMIDPVVETRVETREVIKEAIKEVPVITPEGIDQAARETVGRQLPPQVGWRRLVPNPCEGSFLRGALCTAGTIALASAADYYICFPWERASK